MKPVGETLLVLLCIVLPPVFLKIIIRQYTSSYISGGSYFLLCTLVQPFSFFLRASVLPSAASTLPLLNHLRLSAFSPLFNGFCHFRIFHTSLSAISHISLSPSFLLPEEACGRNVVNSTLCCFLNYYTSMLFVLHNCRNFFSFAHFGTASVVFSARFGAAFCCFNFGFCWSSYVRPLSHLSLLGFGTFVFFRLRC